MVESIQVANIHSVILDKSILKTQQVIALFKALSHCSIIKHVKSAGLIVPRKEIEVLVPPDKHKNINEGGSYNKNE